MKHLRNYPKTQPPQWPAKLLRLFADPVTAEEIEGDLLELHACWLKAGSRTRADRRYICNILKLIRPFAKHRQQADFHKPQPLSAAMIRNHFTIAFRNLFKSKGYSFINVSGLAVGMCCATLIFLMVLHETSYDLHQSRIGQLYRVETENIQENHTYPGTYTGMANALRTDMPQAERVVPILKVSGTVAAANKLFKETVVFADVNLFETFDYQWISGRPVNAFSQPNTVVLTRKYAEKYFGGTDVVGKTIRLDNKQDLTVAGVLEDYPSTTSFPFDILISFPTIKNVNPDYDLNRWNGWNDNFQVFVLLQKGMSPEQLTGRFTGIVRKYIGNDQAAHKRFKINHLSNIHYAGNLGGRSANVSMLKTLSLIGLLVLLIACFNFINLSTAQAFKRAKEVGIRKAIGSNRKLLVYQFLTEAGLITLLAALFSVALSLIALPVMANALAIPLTIAELFTWQNGLFSGVLLILTTLLAGVYPAMRLSGMAPIWGLKTNLIKPANQWFSMRQGLVVVQFTVSLVLISCAMLINRQLDFFRKADLGFNKSAIITVGLPDNKPEKLQMLRQELLRSPQIRDASFSFNSASAESNWMQGMEYRKGPEVIQVKTQMKMADSHYLNTYGIKLLVGEPLSDSDTTDFKVLVNEIFLGRIGIERPAQAIGERLYFGEGNEFATIKGVVKNFNVNSLHQKIDPTIIQLVPNKYYQAGLKLQDEHPSAESVQAALAHIEKTWTAAFPDQLFEYSFLDETLAQAYKAETRTASLIETATFLAVLIACMGLFGQATFTAEQRTKEIGVRKVMGASVRSIVSLLSKDFLKLVMIAFLVASPIAWYAMRLWLQNFEFHIQIAWWIFVASGVLMVLIALLTVSFQSVRAARLDPAKSLRVE